MSYGPYNIMITQVLLSLLVRHIEGGCLGAGSGTGSCPAAPFRFNHLCSFYCYEYYGGDDVEDIIDTIS